MTSKAQIAEGYRRFRTVCAQLVSHVPEPFFVKVGANDGVTGDPCADILLGSPVWRGILIEPVPYVFARLAENYADRSRFTLLQRLIGQERQEVAFYYVHQDAGHLVPDLPDWFDKIGSVSRTHILDHLGSEVADQVIEVSLPMQSLAEVLSEHGITRFELLHTDVEGHDLEVLKSLDLDTQRPMAMLIEQKHLSSEDRTTLYDLLTDHRYFVNAFGGEVFALDRSAPRSLIRAGGFARVRVIAIALLSSRPRSASSTSSHTASGSAGVRRTALNDEAGGVWPSAVSASVAERV